MHQAEQADSEGDHHDHSHRPGSLPRSTRWTRGAAVSGKPEVVIVGAGVGGLTLALLLRQRGIAAEVLEQSAELREAGRGCLAWPPTPHACCTAWAWA